MDEDLKKKIRNYLKNKAKRYGTPPAVLRKTVHHSGRTFQVILDENWMTQHGLTIGDSVLAWKSKDRWEDPVVAVAPYYRDIENMLKDADTKFTERKIQPIGEKATDEDDTNRRYGVYSSASISIPKRLVNELDLAACDVLYVNDRTLELQSFDSTKARKYHEKLEEAISL